MKYHFKLAHGPLTLELPSPDQLPTRTVSHPLRFVTDPSQKLQTEIYLDNTYAISKNLPTGQNIVELFGGIGIYPKMMWDMLHPASWTSVDIDPNVLPHYQEPRGKCVIADAFTYELPDITDIVYIDVPTGTLQTIARDLDGRRVMFDRIFKAQYENIVVTDMGYYWCHLRNHWPWYLAEFGETPNKTNYEHLYDEWMRKTYRYQVINERHGGGCQIFHLVPL